MMFVNVYAGDLSIRKTCNHDRPLNNVLKDIDDCMHVFCLGSVKHRKSA